MLVCAFVSVIKSHPQCRCVRSIRLYRCRWIPLGFPHRWRRSYTETTNRHAPLMRMGWKRRGGGKGVTGSRMVTWKEVDHEELTVKWEQSIKMWKGFNYLPAITQNKKTFPQAWFRNCVSSILSPIFWPVYIFIWIYFILFLMFLFVTFTYRCHSCVLWIPPGTHTGTRWAPCWCKCRHFCRVDGCHSSSDLETLKKIRKFCLWNWTYSIKQMRSKAKSNEKITG